MKKTSLILNALLCIALPTMAQEVPSFTLPDIVIYANADNADTTVDVAKVSIGAAKSVPELLRTTAGIQVQTRPYSGGNEDLTVKLRGHDSRHYTVLIDGIPHNMSGVMGGGYVNWNAIPLGMIDRIEITKGAKSAAHGQTEGGIINIITKEATANNGELQFTAGTHDRRQYIFNYSAQQKDFGFKVYANKAEQDAYLRNSDYENEQAGVNFNYKLNATDKLIFNYDHQQLKRGLVVANRPGADYDSRYPVTPYGDSFSNYQGTPGDGSYTKIFRNNFNLTWSSTRDNASDKITYWKNYEKQREHNVVDGKVVFDRYNVTDKSDGLMYQGSHALNEKHSLGYGADYKRLRYGYGWYNVNTINASALYPSQKLDVWGAYVEDNWQMDERWTTNIGLRYDNMEGKRDSSQATKIGSMSEDALSPKLNVRFKNDAATTTNFSINRIWRAPSMAEFYWHYNNFGFSKGMNLKPEKGWGYETGIAHQFNDKLHSKVTAFYQDIQDYINFTHQRPFNCYNIDSAKIWGVEFENTYQFDDTSSVFLNYTNMHTKKSGVDGRDNVSLHNGLDYRPRHLLTMGYQYDKAKWHARYEMIYTGSQTATLGFPAANPQTYIENNLSSYTVHNISASYDFAKNASVNVALYNIFDEEYTGVYGYQTEGRVFTATLTYNF